MTYSLLGNDIDEFGWLQQSSELLEVGNEQINWLFDNNIHQFIWLPQSGDRLWKVGNRQTNEAIVTL